MITGERSGDLKGMVSELAINHPQPSWQRWARDQVELTKFDSESSSLQNDWRFPDEVPEALPLPVEEPAIQDNNRVLLQYPESIAPGIKPVGAP